MPGQPRDGIHFIVIYPAVGSPVVLVECDMLERLGAMLALKTVRVPTFVDSVNDPAGDELSARSAAQKIGPVCSEP